MDHYPNNEQRGDQHIDRQPEGVPEKWFVLQREGEPPASRQPLEVLLEANRDDDDLCGWLIRAEPGASYMVGGGAAPVVSVRRVA